VERGPTIFSQVVVIQENPGEPIPERTFTHSFLGYYPISSINFWGLFVKRFTLYYGPVWAAGQ